MTRPFFVWFWNCSFDGVMKMPTFSYLFQVETRGFSNNQDIATEVSNAVLESGLDSGISVVFVPGSTAGVTTIEFEPGALADLKKAIARLAPEGPRRMLTTIAGATETDFRMFGLPSWGPASRCHFGIGRLSPESGNRLSWLISTTARGSDGSRSSSSGSEGF